MCVSAAPCVTGCPIHNDIPAYMAKLRAGELDEAVAILLRTNPLPAITGRVCPHTCETDCNRFDYDEPVSIRDVERFLGDYALEHAEDLYRPPAAESGKRVAIVGAGPAGLTAAYFLRQAGHDVTVFDQMPEAGGMLTYSIPAYRLPKDVMAAQVHALEGMGIRFELGAAARQRRRCRWTTSGSAIESVFLATGLWNGKTLRLEKGELLDSGLKFLIDVQVGGSAQPSVGERVLVIGGGSVAVDVALTARRLGATEVTMACLESLETMPAIPEDVEQALEEGITILPSWGPQRVVEQDGKLTGMELVRCTSVFDKDGRFAPTFDPAVKTMVEADQILVAIGQAADLSYAEPGLQDGARAARGRQGDRRDGHAGRLCGRRRHRQLRDDGAGDGFGAKGRGIHRRVLRPRAARTCPPEPRPAGHQRGCAAGQPAGPCPAPAGGSAHPPRRRLRRPCRSTCWNASRPAAPTAAAWRSAPRTSRRPSSRSARR